MQKDSRARAYDDGKVWVLTGGYDLVGAGIYLTVTCAVSPGHDIDALVDKVWFAINGPTDDAEDRGYPGYEALSFENEYGQAPILGRDLPPADIGRVLVQSGRRL